MQPLQNPTSKMRPLSVCPSFPSSLSPSPPPLYFSPFHSLPSTFFAFSFHERDSVTRFSTSGVFRESVSLKHLSIPLRPFQIFSETRGDIYGSRCTTGVMTPAANGKNLQAEKF
jgi:hypothetical protein